MPGRSGVTVVTMLVCLFLSHTRLRVHCAPGIPCALCIEGRTSMQASCENARRDRDLVSQRHCEEQSDEAIHSVFLLYGLPSRSLPSGRHSVDPFAGNRIGLAFLKF